MLQNVAHPCCRLSPAHVAEWHASMVSAVICPRCRILSIHATDCHPSTLQSIIHPCSKTFIIIIMIIIMIKNNAYDHDPPPCLRACERTKWSVPGPRVWGFLRDCRGAGGTQGFPGFLRVSWNCPGLFWSPFWYPLGTSFFRFWCQLGSSLPPNLAPNSSQIRAKRG